MKLTYNSGNEGLDQILYHCVNSNFCFDDDTEVIDYFLFIDGVEYQNYEKVN